MKKKYRKITSALLCILAITMIVLAFPIQAFADEPNESTGPSVLEPTAVIPNPDYDPDADEGSLGTPSLESIPGAGAVDPMVIDPPGGGLIPIGPPNDPIDSGVYTIVNNANQKVVDVRAGGTTAGTVVQQYTDYGSTVNRNQLFKVTYLTSVNGFHYYTIRSMTNSALGLTVDTSGVILDDIGTSDHYTNVASDDRWVITVYDTGIYSIQKGNNLGGYLTTEGSTENEYQLSTATASSTNTRWTFREYTGEAIEGYGWHSAPTEVIPGESVTYSAYMYSTVFHRNGPVTYSLYMDGDTVDNYATIDASTGVLTAINSENIQVRVLPYANAPWLGYKNVEILFDNQIVYTFRNTSYNTFLKPSSVDVPSTLTSDVFDSNATSSLWRIIYAGNGYFKIQNYSTGYYMISPFGVHNMGSVFHSNYSDLQGLWKICKTSDGFYTIQSKAEYESTAPDVRPLYLVNSAGNIIQYYSGSNSKWDLKPLKLNFNVMYDQAFIDRFGEDEYMDVLKNIYAKTSAGEATIPQVLKERYGILVTVTYASNIYESFPYTQNCIHKNNIDTACEDCKNEGSGGADPVGDCEDGYHHKAIQKILTDLPLISTSVSTQINVLYTGHNTCYYDDKDKEHIEVNGLSQNMKNGIVIDASKFGTEINNGDYTSIRKTVLHELLHTFGVNHCAEDENIFCIMNLETKDKYDTKQNLLICSDCHNMLKSHLLYIYYHE